MENNIKNRRIWEIDVLRSFAFIMMFIDHLSYDVASFLLPNFLPTSKIYPFLKTISSYKLNESNYLLNFFFSFGLFIFLSGLSSTLSRNNLKRGLKIFLIGTIYSIGTILLDEYSRDILGTKLYIHVYFGILSSIGLMTIFSNYFKKIPNYALGILGISIIIIGFKLRNVYSTHNFFYILGYHTNDCYYGDYHPLFPALGIYFLGILVGKLFYQPKKSLFKFSLQNKFSEFISKHSLILYFLHQIILLTICGIIIVLIKIF